MIFTQVKSKTIELNPERFLDTKIVWNNEGVVTTQVYKKKTQELHLGFLKFPKDISETQFPGICIDLAK